MSMRLFIAPSVFEPLRHVRYRQVNNSIGYGDLGELYKITCVREVR